MIKSGYKFRIYPNSTQRQILAQEFGNARYLYNNLLAEAKATNKFNWLAASKQITAWRKDFEWLHNGSRTTQQNALANLKHAYNRMFKKQNKYPTFKCRSNHQSITFSGKTHKIEDNKVYVSKMPGGIKAKITRKISTSPKQMTISKTPSGKYYVSFNADREIPLISTNTNTIGIDLGLIDFIAASDDTKISNPKWMLMHEIRLKRYQRKYSRIKAKLKSNRKVKLREKLAKQHEKVTNARLDFHHKLSSSLVKNNKTICIENLNISGMLKNKHLSKSIQQAGWGQFVNMLKYKGNWYGTQVIEIGTFVPSSKICNCCGYKLQDLNLGTRTWTCPSCNAIHDRDINAAKNIHSAGLAQINAQGLVRTRMSCEEIVEHKEANIMLANL
jgi:putative transposase